MDYVKDIMDVDGSILKTEWNFNGNHYRLIGTSQGDDGRCPATKARDTLLRNDGKVLSMTRHIMSDYFGGHLRNIRLIEEDIIIFKEGNSK